MKATTARSTTEISTMSNRIERVAGGSFVRSNSNSPMTGIAMTATIANKEVRLRSLMSNWTVLASSDACFHPFALIHTNQAVRSAKRHCYQTVGKSTVGGEHEAGELRLDCI